MKDMMIGVDLAKTVFQVHGALQTGGVQFRKKLTRKTVRRVHGQSRTLPDRIRGLLWRALLVAGDGSSWP